MLIRRLSVAAEMEKVSAITKIGCGVRFVKMTNNSLTIDQVMVILNCTRSYVYKLLRTGGLEYCDATGPIKVTAKSVLAYMGKRYPFLLENCYSALHYHVSKAA